MKESGYEIKNNCIYIGISLFVLVLIAISVIYIPFTVEFDCGIIHTVQGLFASFPMSIPLFISEFGLDNYWLWPRVTAASVLVSHKYYIRAFLFIIITRSIYFFNNDLIKNIVTRERPCGDELPGYSFPSGHASMAMCFFGILIYLIHRYVRTDWWRISLIILFSFWIVIMGISRIWLNAHYFTDVLAGYLVGFIFVNLYIILDKFFSK